MSTVMETTQTLFILLLLSLASASIADDMASDNASGMGGDMEGHNALTPVTSFDSIEDEIERSKALFAELSKVLLHPRCVNCHPAGDQPLRNDLEPHEPPVWRGEDGEGAVGMHCGACHSNDNFNFGGNFGGDPGSVPGAPHWSLAPEYTAWEGKSVSYICEQIQDPERNGGMDHEALILHMEDDPLVAWGWDPGEGREPAPGTQAEFAELVKAWIASGAACP